MFKDIKTLKRAIILTCYIFLIPIAVVVCSSFDPAFLGFVGFYIILLSSPIFAYKILKKLSDQDRKLLCYISGFVMVLAVFISTTRISFVGMKVDRTLIYAALTSYFILHFYAFYRKQKEEIKKIKKIVLTIFFMPVLIFYLISIIGFFGVMFVLFEYEPRYEGDYSKGYYCRVFGYGAAFTSNGGYKAHLLKKLSYLPFLEKEKNSKITDNQYSADLRSPHDLCREMEEEMDQS